MKPSECRGFTAQVDPGDKAYVSAVRSGHNFDTRETVPDCSHLLYFLVKILIVAGLYYFSHGLSGPNWITIIVPASQTYKFATRIKKIPMLNNVPSACSDAFAQESGMNCKVFFVRL